MNLEPRHKGFILPEVIIALMVIAVALTTLLVLQATVFRRVVMNVARISRLYPLKNNMLDSFKNPLAKDEKMRESVNEQLNTKIVYEQSPISPKSKLARFEGLYQKKVTGSWYDQRKERTQELITYGFRPVEKEK